jgi:hypothetical protein
VTGKKVLLSPEWINNVTWTDSPVCVDLTRGAIKMRPNTTRRAPSIVIVKPEARLHEHYGRQGYRVDRTA